VTATVSADPRFDDPSELARIVASLPAPLLLCTDIDGTLSTITQTPGEARLVEGADQALRSLVREGIDVAVV
jgi:trehalose-6-phosphatase